MDIFGQLGINTTAGFQFVFFVIAMIFLTKTVFGPYAHALQERQKRTTGGEDLATEFRHKTVELQSEYENKMRALNHDIKAIVDDAKALATKNYEAAVSGVRAESEGLVQANRSKVTAAVQAASAELKAQTNAIAMAITTKLLK